MDRESAECPPTAITQYQSLLQNDTVALSVNSYGNSVRIIKKILSAQQCWSNSCTFKSNQEL